MLDTHILHGLSIGAVELESLTLGGVVCVVKSDIPCSDEITENFDGRWAVVEIGRFNRFSIGTIELDTVRSGDDLSGCRCRLESE